LEEARENLKDALQMGLGGKSRAERTRTHATRRNRACLKRAELEKHLRVPGCQLYPEGGKHSVWWNPANRKTSAVPRHREINDYTARSICRSLEVPEPKTS
jgi:mRNA interferase HicA